MPKDFLELNLQNKLKKNPLRSLKNKNKKKSSKHWKPSFNRPYRYTTRKLIAKNGLFQKKSVTPWKLEKKARYSKYSAKNMFLALLDVKVLRTKK